MKNESFKFWIGEKVVIIPNKLYGKVITVSHSLKMTEPRYSVQYVDANGAIFETYLDESELKKEE